MHSLGLVSNFELVWHLAKPDQEHAEVLRECSFLRERAVARPAICSSAMSCGSLPLSAIIHGSTNSSSDGDTDDELDGGVTYI